MIRTDPELTAIYDRNDDGQITYADFHDTTHLHEDGMSAEEDAVATEAWLKGLAEPDAGSRARALWQQFGAGQNMALFTNRRRKQIVPSKKGKGSYNRAKEKRYVNEHRKNDG